MPRPVPRVDPLSAGVVVAGVLGLVLPATGSGSAALATATDVAIVALFFLYGARLPTREVVAGVRHVRLQAAVLVVTFGAFPLLGLALQGLPDAVAGPEVRAGLLYLTLLPSTVQSSVVFTSIAGGNVAGSLTAATVSNLVGVVATPALVALTMTSSTGGVGADALLTVVGLILLPFAAGQLAQRWWGPWLRAHRGLTATTDRTVIWLVVYTSVSHATTAGVWRSVTWAALAWLVAISVALLAAVLAGTWWLGGRLGLARPDRIALQMGGSKKSLATGLPMAAVLFAPATAAAMALPVIVYHQVQLVVCAWLAQRLGAQGTVDVAPPRRAQ